MRDHFDDSNCENEAPDLTLHGITSKAVLNSRVSDLESQLAAVKSELEAARTAAYDAQEARQLAEHNAAQLALDHRHSEGADAAQLSAELQKLTEDHNKQVYTLQQTNQSLKEQLEDQKLKNQRLILSLENNAQSNQATRELASHIADLERRNATLRCTVEAERSQKDQLILQLRNAEANPQQCTTAIRQSTEAKAHVEQLTTQLTDMKSKLEVESEVCQAQTHTLQQVLSIIKEAVVNDYTGNSGSSSAQKQSASGGSGIKTSKTALSTSTTAIPSEPLELARAVANKVSAIESALQVAAEGDDRLQTLLSQEMLESKQLAGEVAASRADADAARSALDLAESKLVELTKMVDDLEAKLQASEQQASASSAEITALRDSQAALTERAQGMREAASNALKDAATVKQQVATERQQIRQLVKPLLLSFKSHNSSSSRRRKGDDEKEVIDTMSLVDAVALIVGMVSECEREKKVAVSERRKMKKENGVLTGQLRSLSQVVETVLEHAGSDEQLTLHALAQTQSRVCQLEAANAELQYTVDGAYRAATHDWNSMHHDMERLVAHAEQAQQDAERALSQQEAEAAALKQQVVVLQQRLQDALTHQSSSGNNNNRLPQSLELTSRELASIQQEVALATQRQALQGQTKDLQCKLAAVNAEVSAARTEAAAAAARCVELEGKLSQAKTVCSHQSTALKLAKEELEAARAREAATVSLSQEAAVLRQQLEVTKQRCDVLESRLEVSRGMGAIESTDQKSRLLRRYMSGMNALARALSQLQDNSSTNACSSNSTSIIEEATAAPEKLVDAVLLHLHQRDLDVTGLRTQVVNLEAAMKRSLVNFG